MADANDDEKPKLWEQTKMDSFMEAATNTAIGFVISLAVTFVTFGLYHIHTRLVENLGITAIFTLVSIVRSYTLRRMFNGRSAWAYFRGSHA